MLCEAENPLEYAIENHSCRRPHMAPVSRVGRGFIQPLPASHKLLPETTQMRQEDGPWGQKTVGGEIRRVRLSHVEIRRARKTASSDQEPPPTSSRKINA